MNTNQNLSYKHKQTRYSHYFRRLNRIYQKPVARVSSALLFTIFTIIFFAAFAIRPTLTTISELIRKIEDQREVLSDLKKKATVLGSVQNEYALVATKVPLLNTAIPTSESTKELLTMIEALASVHQIPITNITAQDFVITSGSDKNKEKEIVVTASLEGTYQELKNFLEDIDRLPRFTTIETIKFTPPAAEAEKENSDIRMIIGLRAYYISQE
jgi:Tfp pilus assembly protein PilO